MCTRAHFFAGWVVLWAVYFWFVAHIYNRVALCSSEELSSARDDKKTHLELVIFDKLSLVTCSIFWVALVDGGSQRCYHYFLKGHYQQQKNVHAAISNATITDVCIVRIFLISLQCLNSIFGLTFGFCALLLAEVSL